MNEWVNIIYSISIPFTCAIKIAANSALVKDGQREKLDETDRSNSGIRKAAPCSISIVSAELSKDVGALI